MRRAALALLAGLAWPAAAQEWLPAPAAQLAVYCWPAEKVIEAVERVGAQLVFAGDTGGPARYMLFAGPRGWIFLAGSAHAPGTLCPILWNLKGAAE